MAMKKSLTHYTSTNVNAYRSVMVYVLIFTVLALASCSGETDPLPQMYTMKQVTVDGGNISYIEEGEGMPIVLVHGIPTSSFLWRKMIGNLAVFDESYPRCELAERCGYDVVTHTHWQEEAHRFAIFAQIDNPIVNCVAW